MFFPTLHYAYSPWVIAKKWVQHCVQYSPDTYTSSTVHNRSSKVQTSRQNIPLQKKDQQKKLSRLSLSFSPLLSLFTYIYTRRENHRAARPTSQIRSKVETIKQVGKEKVGENQLSPFNFSPLLTPKVSKKISCGVKSNMYLFPSFLSTEPSVKLATF